MIKDLYFISFLVRFCSSYKLLVGTRDLRTLWHTRRRDQWPMRKWLWNAYFCVRPHTRRRDRWLDLISVETTPKKASPPEKAKKKQNKTKQNVTERQPARKGPKKKNVTDGHWTSFLSKLRRKRPAHRKRAKKKKNVTDRQLTGKGRKKNVTDR